MRNRSAVTKKEEEQELSQQTCQQRGK